MPDNFERMVRLAEEFFETKGDPEQLSVNEGVIDRLRAIHPATMSEERDENGPIAWVLLIPATLETMERFLACTIHERELLAELPAGQTYEAIYLCSALVLPEYRRRGIARRLTVRAIRSICADFPIKYLFYWPFSPEGEAAAAAVAAECRLPLRARLPG